MNFEAYLELFEQLLHQSPDQLQGLYAHEGYIDYTKLNWSRMNRWIKTGVLSRELIDTLEKIREAQQWIVITEPWCGDAAHIVPFIQMASRCNPLISVSYELRDTEPFRIEQYLTNGSKSIPKLIVRNTSGEDLGVWGLRPRSCQELYQNLKAAHVSGEEIKTTIQQWYNADKGSEIQKEIGMLLSSKAGGAEQQ